MTVRKIYCRTSYVSNVSEKISFVQSRHNIVCTSVLRGPVHCIKRNQRPPNDGTERYLGLLASESGGTEFPSGLDWRDVSSSVASVFIEEDPATRN